MLPINQPTTVQSTTNIKVIANLVSHPEILLVIQFKKEEKQSFVINNHQPKTS